ncbi:MAG: ABC transporter permease subunit [Flavonifractor plautii]
MFLYMQYTKQGYEIAVVGESENTARYAGMNVGRVIMRTMFLSGAICRPGGLLAVLRRRQHPPLRRSRRRGLHRHHRGLAGQAQPLRHGVAFPPSGRPDGRASDTIQTRLQDPRLGLRRHHRHHPLLHAGL